MVGQDGSAAHYLVENTIGKVTLSGAEAGKHDRNSEVFKSKAVAALLKEGFELK